MEQIEFSDISLHKKFSIKKLKSLQLIFVWWLFKQSNICIHLDGEYLRTNSFQKWKIVKKLINYELK